MSDRWPTPEETRDAAFARLTAEEKLRWLEQAKEFVRANLGRARDEPGAPPPPEPKER